MTVNRRIILGEVENERRRQIAKWGEDQQTHPHVSQGGDTLPFWRRMLGHARSACRHADKEGTIAWEDILWEEVCEAHCETEWPKRRAELIQVMAVACAEIEDGDAREAAMRRHPASLIGHDSRCELGPDDEPLPPLTEVSSYSPGDSEQNSAGAST